MSYQASILEKMRMQAIDPNQTDRPKSDRQTQIRMTDTQYQTEYLENLNEVANVIVILPDPTTYACGYNVISDWLIAH